MPVAAVAEIVVLSSGETRIEPVFTALLIIGDVNVLFVSVCAPVRVVTVAVSIARVSAPEFSSAA